MKRRGAITLALVLSVSVFASPHLRSTGQTLHLRTPLEEDGLGLLPSGVGQSSMMTATQFYSAFSSEFTGTGAFLFDAVNEVDRRGSSTWTANGTPALATKGECNNGPNCASYSSRRLTGSTSVFYSGPSTPPGGDFSLVIVFKPTAFSAGNSDLFNQFTSAANSTVLVRISSAGAMTCQTSNGVGFTSVSIGTPTLQAWNIAVCTYQRVGGATNNISKGYLNSGTATATQSSGNLTTAAATGAWLIGKLGDNTDATAADVAYAGLTMKELSATTIGLMADAALGTLTTSQGTAVTTTRTGQLTCTNDSWATMTTVVPARPCVAGNALQSFPGATNLELRSDAWDNAAHTDVGTPTVVANAANNAAGVPTADTIQDDDAAAFEGRAQAMATVSQTTFTWSAWLANTSGTPHASVTLVGTGDATGDTTCNFTLTTTLTRYICTAGAAYGVGITAVTATIRVGTTTAAVGTIAVADSQFETGSIATPYIRTEAATVTRAAEKVQATETSTGGVSATDWCVKAKVWRTPTGYDTAWNAGTTARTFWYNDVSGNGFVQCYISTTGRIQCDIQDSAAGSKNIFSGVNTLTTEASATVRACYNGTTFAFYKDGTLQTTSTAGAGTGILPGLATLHGFGATITGSSPIAGGVSDLCFDSGQGACQ